MISAYTLDLYLARRFLPVFFVALALFSMLAVLLELFLYLTRYLANGAELWSILAVSFFYIPKSIGYALPVSLLFACAYTFGDLGTKNELRTIFGSGISIWRFSFSLLLIGIIISFFSFFFEDHIVIPAMRKKNALHNEILQIYTENLSSIVFRAEGGNLVYSVDYFESHTMNLYGITIIELEDNKFHNMLYAPQAQWTGNSWYFFEPVYYAWDEGFLLPNADFDPDKFQENPDTFRIGSISPKELKINDLILHIQDLRRSGLPAASAITDYHQRFSFSAISFIVIFISISVSGRFKKNILLLSLLASLGAAVIFYVLRMLGEMSAQFGLITPFLGAWIPVFFFIIAGLFMIKYSKT